MRTTRTLVGKEVRPHDFRTIQATHIMARSQRMDSTLLVEPATRSLTTEEKAQVAGRPQALRAREVDLEAALAAGFCHTKETLRR